MLSQAIQDYLKAIYKLQENEPVSTTDLSKELGVSGASVTGMLKRLASMGLIEYSSYHGAKLTPTGEKAALETIRFHRLLELYLKEKLNYPLEKVHEEACRLEHFISEEFVERITKILGDPKFDPHGHPIPSKEGKVSSVNEFPLTEGEIGKTYLISHLEDDRPELLGYLESRGLLPDSQIQIVDKTPINDTVTINIKNQNKNVIIGYEVAKRIYIRK